MNESSQLSSKPQSRDDGGVTALDCAVIVAFIAVLVVTAVGVMSQQSNAMLGDVRPAQLERDHESAAPVARGR
jgi:Flp pilus assembly pilin Flp